MVLVTSWTRPPQHVWTIDEVKNGNIIATYTLNDIIRTQHSKNGFPSITFGRIADDPSIVDIVTAHESCSRQHARIAFDCRGTPWLRDLGSGNGTFVNEKRLPPEACGKDQYESTTTSSNRKGSRGVVLYPGDAIRFGASTRLYILEGPEEFERGASNHGMMGEVKEEGRAASSSDSHSETTSSRPQHQQCDGDGELTEDLGCSWGIAADDSPQTDDGEQRVQRYTGDLPLLPSIESFFSSSSGKNHIPINLHQLHSQYNTRMHKLQSIQTESQRILQKENAGVELTDGQRRQLGKNQERISTLEKEVATFKDKIEDGIFAVIHGKERGVKRPREDHQYNAEDEDDDCFYDRTASPSKRIRDENAAAVESEASLIQKWKSLLQGHAKQRLLVDRALERCRGLEKIIDNAADDSDDIFFLKNDLTLANDNLSKANKELVNTEKELDECEYLMKTVNDKLIWDRKAGVIGTNVLINGEATEMVHSDAKHVSSQLVAENDSSKTMLSPPPTSVSCASSAWNMPPPSSSETCRPSAPGEDVGATELQKTKKIIGPSRPPAQGTLAVLKKASLAPLPNKTALKTAESAMTLNPLEKQKDEWKAPIDQDGSGRTALHDKFKGRY